MPPRSAQNGLILMMTFHHLVLYRPLLHQNLWSMVTTMMFKVNHFQALFHHQQVQMAKFIKKKANKDLKWNVIMEFVKKQFVPMENAQNNNSKKIPKKCKMWCQRCHILECQKSLEMTLEWVSQKWRCQIFQETLEIWNNQWKICKKEWIRAFPTWEKEVIWNQNHSVPLSQATEIKMVKFTNIKVNKELKKFATMANAKSFHAKTENALKRSSKSENWLSSM